MSVPKYKRTIIGENDNSAFTNMNTFITLGDLNQNGRLDVIISGRDGNMIWLENPGNPITSWEQHMIDCIEKLECGGTTIDLTRNGYADIICGGDWRSDNVYWWENPGKENTPWRRHIITQTGFTQFHDEIIGDITNDGRISLLFNNQGNGSLN